MLQLAILWTRRPGSLVYQFTGRCGLQMEWTFDWVLIPGWGELWTLRSRHWASAGPDKRELGEEDPHTPVVEGNYYSSCLVGAEIGESRVTHLGDWMGGSALSCCWTHTVCVLVDAHTRESRHAHRQTHTQVWASRPLMHLNTYAHTSTNLHWGQSMQSLAPNFNLG